MDVKERFLKYVSFDTQSDPHSQTMPSSEKQKELGKYLAEELKSIGLEDAHMDEHGYVYAHLPASEGIDIKAMGLVAHMDTSPAVSGADIKARSLVYEGGDIVLSEGIVTEVEKFAFLNDLVGHELIVTDGTTLLGGDDKAGVAEIVTAVEYLINHPEVKHGKICIAFTPDEEVGRGPECFDYETFGADYAYTLDGGPVGGIDYENFNAASCDVTVHGISSHTGDAKGMMKNAIRIANEFVSMLPKDEIPERTCLREGFFHLDAMEGDVVEAHVGMIIRDHDFEKFEGRKALAEKIGEDLNKEYGEGTVEVCVNDTYFNMLESLKPHMFIVEQAKNAYKMLGIEAKSSPVRGGTDGATFSNNQLPCPNLSTGGYNFHGIYELVDVEQMKTMVQVVLGICKLAVENK